MSEIILVDGMFCDEHKFNDGGSITKLSFNVEKFIQFLNQHANEKGYVNIDVARSQQSQKLYGKLNQWKPNNQQQSNQQGGQNSEYQDKSYPNEFKQNEQGHIADNNERFVDDQSQPF